MRLRGSMKNIMQDIVQKLAKITFVYQPPREQMRSPSIPGGRWVCWAFKGPLIVVFLFEPEIYGDFLF